MNSLAFILLLGGSPQGGGGGLGSFLPLILIMVVFYVFMILPQTRKAKAQKKFREIVEMDDTSMVIELEEGVRMRIERSSVSMEATKALNNPAGDTKK